MRRVATGWDISEIDDCAKGVLLRLVQALNQEGLLVLTSSKLTVTKKSLCSLSPAPVQKCPIFLGLIFLTANGGLLNGGVGTCKMGNGGAFEDKGSVTPGIEGIKGGRLIPKGFFFCRLAGVAEPCVAK